MLGLEHPKRSDALDAKADAHVRDFDLLERRRNDLVGDDRVPKSVGMCHEVRVTPAHERVQRSLLIVLGHRPRAHKPETGKNRRGRFEEERPVALPGPCLRVVAESDEFVPNCVDAEQKLSGIRGVEPIPEGRTKIEAIVEILCLNEHVGVKKVRH